ncbi:MAG: hypothetical protein SFV81_01775 [Pirellulaceae bacterium]|nr:hypothetical protein [Pirellulaceae bacterium]
MTRHILRTIFAFLVGFSAAFALVIGTELLSNTLYPLPAGFGHTQEEVCSHVANYPAWVLTIVVAAWGLIGWIGVWLAHRIGNAYSSGMLGLLLVAAVGLNISMLPYPIWFKLIIMLVMPLACWNGVRVAGASRSMLQHAQ